MRIRVRLEIDIGPNQSAENGLLTDTSWGRIRLQIQRRDKSRCHYCGRLALHGHVDHVMPLSKGGTDEPDNLVWSCERCNLEKGDEVLDGDFVPTENLELVLGDPEHDQVPRSAIPGIDVTLFFPPDYSDQEPPAPQIIHIPTAKRNPNGLRDFSQAIIAGLATFSEKGARRGGKRGAVHYGYNQDEWCNLREAFVSANMADRTTAGGAKLNSYGQRLLTTLANPGVPPTEASI